MVFRLFDNTLIFGFGSKISLETNLETDLNLGAILERFGYHELGKIEIQIHSKTTLETTSFPEPLLGGLGAA